MISSKSRYVSEYPKYHRTQRMMITSSKCRPRNSAGRLRVTIHRTRSAQSAFATEPDICTGLRGAVVRVERRRDGSVAVRFREKYLRHKLCARAPRAGQPKVRK